MFHNCCTHVVKVWPDADSSREVVYPPAERAARANFTHVFEGAKQEEGVPVAVQVVHLASDLPQPELGHRFIVSTTLYALYPERKDLVFPAGLVKDGAQNVLACRLLSGHPEVELNAFWKDLTHH